MNPIATAIKAIVEGQGLTYLRSININDLNEQVGNIDLSGGCGVYTSVPEIDNLNYVGGTVVSNYSIEVYYLLPNSETDDKGEAVDVVLDSLKPLADEFFDRMRRQSIISPSVLIEGYSLDAVETLKMTKEVLTGWRLRMVVPIDRSTFYCG